MALSLDRPQGLYRLRITPPNNQILYSLAINNVQWYAMECWEPRFNFYVFGRTNPPHPQEPLPKINQYFFIPRLPAGETVRIRLQTEKQTEQAKMTIYRGESEQIASFETRGRRATSSQKPYFNTLELSGSDLPASDPGEVYRFELSSPIADEQPGGNTWVRFSRNVPPYFANEANRLIYPIVHRAFEPVLYAGETQTYRSFLTVHRDNTDIIPTNSRLVMAVNTATGSSAADAYTQALSVTAPSTPLKVSGSQALAQLQSDASSLIADSTDKVDTVYFVKKPTYPASWPAKVLLAYDNGNGGASSVLKAAHFNTVQTDNPDTLPTITGQCMKAMGVLYASERMKTWFKTDCNADSCEVRFWAIFDEPDTGPGPEGEVKSLKTDIYDTYYTLKQATTSDKPFSLNIAQPIFIEEFSRGCDIISSDPFVRSTGDDNINRIRDCAQELSYNASGVNDVKKTFIILWWWNPKADDPPATASDELVYQSSFDLAKDSVDGLGGWNFSGDGNRLDTSPSLRITLLWTAIKSENASV